MVSSKRYTCIVSCILIFCANSHCVNSAFDVLTMTSVNVDVLISQPVVFFIITCNLILSILHVLMTEQQGSAGNRERLYAPVKGKHYLDPASVLNFFFLVAILASVKNTFTCPDLFSLARIRFSKKKKLTKIITKLVARQATLLWVFSHPSLFSVARGNRATINSNPVDPFLGGHAPRKLL